MGTESHVKLPPKGMSTNSLLMIVKKQSAPKSFDNLMLDVDRLNQTRNESPQAKKADLLANAITDALKILSYPYGSQPEHKRKAMELLSSALASADGISAAPQAGGFGKAEYAKTLSNVLDALQNDDQLLAVDVVCDAISLLEKQKAKSGASQAGASE
ncbi:MAG: hypothetical protein WCY41_01620 [Candidatus Micrarchaeia archaeon]